MAITKRMLQEIQLQGCAHPECDHSSHNELFLRSKCHISEGVEISIKFAEEIVLVACAKCHKKVVEIAIAE